MCIRDRFKEYFEIIKKNEVQEVIAAATEGVRKAENKDELTKRFEKVFGWFPGVISGEEEAKILKQANLEFTKIYGKFLLFDIGGGSTELIIDSPKDIEVISIPIGVLRLLERYFKNSLKLPEPRLNEIINLLKTEISENASELLNQDIPVIGTGGTVTTLICIYKGLKRYNHLKVHHSHIPVEEIENILDTLNALDLEERREIIGVDPDRADIMIPGILIILAILQLTRQHKLIISDKGMLFGLIYRFIMTGKKHGKEK